MNRARWRDQIVPPVVVLGAALLLNPAIPTRVALAPGADAGAVKPTHIVRSAVIAPDGSSIYAHSVTRASRRDNGVARFDLAGASSVVVPPLPESAAFGPTF